MLGRPLRLIAIVCSLLVAAGWLMFAIDQTSEASKASAAEIAGQRISAQADPDPDLEATRERLHDRGREAIDDANDVLLRPFAAIADGYTNDWVRRTLPAVFALLLYGFGGGMLARYMADR